MSAVLLVAPYSLWRPHFAVDLELALNCNAVGDEVTWLECRGELAICDISPDGKASRCARCIARRDMGIRIAGARVTRISVAEVLRSDDLAALDGLPQEFGSIEELRSFRFRGFDAGFAALSSTVWVAKEAELDLTVEPHRARVRGFLRSACAMFLATNRLVQRGQFRQAFLFNGRMAPMRGAFRALREHGVDSFIHERGCDMGHYALSRNALPHEIAPMEVRIRGAWEQSELTPEERVEVALGWFERRSAGKSTTWFSFTEQQERGQLPASWDAKRHNIVIFTTSEYEFASISDEWNNPLYASNAQAVLKVARECSQLPGTTVYVRLHPNLTGLSDPVARGLHAQGNDNVSVIGSSSKVCSYALIEHADKIVVTGSTVGIEAAVRGKAVVLVGRCYYEGLEAVHIPQSKAQLSELLDDRELASKETLGAHMYGFFMATFGVPYAHFKASSLATGTFDGDEMRPALWRQELHRLQLIFKRALGKGRV